VEDYDETRQRCLCPFHEEDTPSFIYNPKTYECHCFGCQANADFIDAYMKGRNATFIEATEKLFETAGIQHSFGEHRVQTRRQYRYPKPVECEDKSKAYKYMKARKISQDTADYLDIRQDKEGNLVFNYYDLNDVLTMVKYRPSRRVRKGENKVWCQQGADTTPLLFNMNRINPLQPLVICCGELDCAALIESGIQNAVSIPLGDGNTHWIEECWDFLEQFNEIILTPDNDQAGNKFVKEVVPRLGSWRCKIASCPELYEAEDGKKVSIKDVNETLFYYGREKVAEIIANAADTPVPSVIDLSEVSPTEYEDVDGVTFGLKNLDGELMRLFFGTLTIISGQPGAGKSSLLTQLMCNAIDNGIRSWLFSGELPNGVEKSWFNYIFAGPRNIEDAISRKGNPYKKISSATIGAINTTYKGQWYIYRDDYDNTLDGLIESMTDAVRKYGVRCLILDNFMCIDTEQTEEELRSQTITIKRLIEFAKKYQAAVVLVCHPRKMDASTNVGIYDIAGTSNIVNLAHRTIGLRRITDEERDNSARFSERRQRLLKYDVIATIIKDRMFGRQNIDEGLYYDSLSRRFFCDMAEYDRKFSWDRNDYSDNPLALPRQLAEERAADEEVYGKIKKSDAG